MAKAPTHSFDVADSGLRHECRRPIGSVEFSQVACDAVLQLLHPCPELAVSEVLVAVVDCLEPDAVRFEARSANGHHMRLSLGVGM
jgi:hypothetical protein